MWLICDVNVTTLLCCCCESECECAALQQQHNGLDYCLSMAFVKPLCNPHTSEKAFVSVFCHLEQLRLNNALWRWAVFLLSSLLATNIRGSESRCLTTCVTVARAFPSARSEEAQAFQAAVSATFEEEPDCVDVDAIAQAQAEVFVRAVAIAIAKTVALVADDDCVNGSGANAIASAVGIAKHLAQAFALAIAKTPTKMLRRHHRPMQMPSRRSPRRPVQNQKQRLRVWE